MAVNDCDIAGKQFGRWTALEAAEPLYAQKTPAWLCRCKCGKEKVVSLNSLVNGKSLSCGCLQKEIAAELGYKHGGAKDGHIERLYKVLQDMKDRCNNKNNKYYNRYGGRGIKVCDEWLHDYQAFKEWAYANGYNEDTDFGECTIDRIDNDKGYYPNNCRWVNLKVQANNRSSNILYEFNNEKHTLPQWCDILNLNCNLVRNRLSQGMSFEKAITQEKRSAKVYKYNDEIHTVKEWAEIFNTTDKAIYSRIARGWPIDRVFAQPFRKRGD